MEKETLTLYKIKRDLNQRILLEIRVLVISILLMILLFGLLRFGIHNLLSDRPNYYVFDIITALLLLIILIIWIVSFIKMLIQYKTGKLIIETDELIRKEERIFKSINWAGLKSGLTIGAGKYDRAYRLYFKCNGKFEIPTQKSYKWSVRYSMKPRNVFNTADEGDKFTIVKSKGGILMVYNNKYFKPSSVLL